jgi:PqqD family protein of HPr-rel-A system
LGQVSTSTSRLEPVWTVPGVAGFKWRFFDTISVLFDPRSGEMHLLDPMAREILDILSESPMTTSDLVDALAGIMENTEIEDVRARVTDMVTQFDRIGLIFPTYRNAA